ncbi:MAG: ATP-binding protein, partial [Thermoanaerobaculia bacterium]|nr:ATP-binding protein [Thermoanaerobaculia bacterium]
RLAPHDDDWVPAGGQRSTTYTGLSPGRYHFAVAASVGGSPWSAAAETELVLRPFFWQTRWFFALVVVAIGGGASALYRLRVRRLVELERLRLRIASDLHDELGSELSGISLASAMLESEDDLRDPARRRLGEIRASSSRLLERLRDIVWLIDPGGDGVGPLAERMEMVAESLTPGIRLEFAADAVAAELPLSMTQRRDLLLLLRELVTNAVRHAGASAIRVRFEARNDRLELEVRDDGCGFEPTAASSGSGLRSVRDRAAALGGELTIESGAGAGTRALLSVPMMTRSRGSAGRRWKAR